MNRLEKHKATLKSWLDDEFKPIEFKPGELLGDKGFDLAYDKLGQKWFWVIYEDSEDIVNKALKNLKG